MTSKPLALVGRKHPALHEPAHDVEPNDPEAARVADRMLATLKAINRGDISGDRGLALAAPQVGVRLRLVVFAGPYYLGVSRTRELIVANLQLVPTADDTIETLPEGCLSIPGRRFAVPRTTTCKASGMTLGGEWASWESETALEARLFQHEVDHLAGRLISDTWPEVRGGRQ